MKKIRKQENPFIVTGWSSIVVLLIELIFIIGMLFLMFESYTTQNIYKIPPKDTDDKLWIETLFGLEYSRVLFLLFAIGFICSSLVILCVLYLFHHPLGRKSWAEISLKRVIIYGVICNLLAILLLPVFVSLNLLSQSRIQDFVIQYAFTGILLGQWIVRVLMVIIIPIVHGYRIAIGRKNGKPALIKVPISRKIL